MATARKSEGAGGVAERRSAKTLLWGAGALVAAALAVAVAVWPSPAPRTPRTRPVASAAAFELPPRARQALVTPDEIEESDEGADAATAALRPQEETVDLFAGPAPEIISKGYQFASEGRMLRSDKVKEVYEFGKQHPGDARPHIILGIDSMNRGWYGFAVGHYLKATQQDPRAKKDPRVMEDLLSVAGNQHYSDKAHEALAKIYGREALPAAKQALADATSEGNAVRTEHLGRLVGKLDQMPE
jgi:hypothetical protein